MWDFLYANFTQVTPFREGILTLYVEGSRMSPLIAVYYSLWVPVASGDASNFQVCRKWTGPYRMPTRENGPRIPLLLLGDDGYDAAKVGYMADCGGEYPLAWYHMTCKNLWCVNGNHVVLEERSQSGRRTKSLETTTHYDERYALIKEWLQADPLMLSFEVHYKLRGLKIGGKNITVQRIIAKVRQELSLPARIPSRRKKVETV